MSEDLTVTYSGLSADERRVIINDKRAVRLRHGCAITERRALDRTASELQDTCHKQAQRIEVLEQAGAVPLDEARRLFDAGWKAAARFCDREDVVADGIIGFGACPQFEAAFAAANGIKGGQHA